jgi:hypothetical protein
MKNSNTTYQIIIKKSIKFFFFNFSLFDQNQNFNLNINANEKIYRQRN